MDELWWIHSDDETPHLGSGRRAVVVRKTRQGKRRLLIVNADGINSRQSVTRRVWHAIKKERIR